MTSIYLSHVSKAFPDLHGQSNSVLRDVSINLPGPKFLTIIGPNGCGKSTLLNLIAGLLQPDSGTVTIRTEHGKAPRVGYVWQDYRASLLPWADVVDNITFPLRLEGMGRADRFSITGRVLDEFKLSIRPDQHTYTLSGGQQQLISILRSTVARPDLLLLDEPLSALDQSTSWMMAFHLERVWQQLNVPALLVSHDIDEGIALADEILLMGRSSGKIDQVLRNPLPRPRTVKVLTSKEHIQCREAVIEFLFEGSL